MAFTGAFVEKIRLPDVARTESNPLADLRSFVRDHVRFGQNRVHVHRPSERVSGVMHDAGEIVRFAQRMDVFIFQFLKIVVLP